MKKKIQRVLLSERGDSSYISSFVYIFAVVIMIAFIINVFHIISVKQEMDHPSRLLEHVAWRIVGRLFKDFPPLQAVELHLKKRNPPMGADITSAGVRITVRREEWGKPA